MLSVQYIVNCQKEEHVCNGITTQDPRPRPDSRRKLSTLDITQLFFQDTAQERKKVSRTCTHTRQIRPFSSKETTE